MREHACTMIWEAAGRPDPTEPVNGEGRCAHCGVSGPLSMTIGPNFTDYRLLADVTGTRLCVACSWAFGGKPPRTLRMWSIVVRRDRPAPAVAVDAYAGGVYLQLTNRKDLTWIASTLAEPPDGPWLAAVAETGQKHTAPFAAVNYGSGLWTVRTDGVDVTCDPVTWRMLLGHSAVLRSERPNPRGGKPLFGFSAAAVESGQPPVTALDPDGLRLWRQHAEPLKPWWGTPVLHLANYMITKETCGHYVTAYPAG